MKIINRNLSINVQVVFLLFWLELFELRVYFWDDILSFLYIFSLKSKESYSSQDYSTDYCLISSSSKSESSCQNFNFSLSIFPSTKLFYLNSYFDSSLWIIFIKEFLSCNNYLLSSRPERISHYSFYILDNYSFFWSILNRFSFIYKLIFWISASNS